jgi:flagellar motor protein MotB
MQGRARWMALAVLGLAAIVATGCGNPQQSEERNLALGKQLEAAQRANAELQAQNQTLVEQRDAFAAEADQLRAKAGAATTRPGLKPDFGPGTETILVGKSTTITLSDAILFDSGKADLKPASKKVLDKIAAVLNKDYGGDKIRVEGHTDKQPIAKSSKNWEDNWELSSARALAVVRYLAGRGVDPARLSGDAFGPYKPVAKGDMAAALAKNRRVVIVVNP